MPFNFRILALGFLFSSLWASAFTAGRFAIQSAPPLVFLSIRFALAFVVIAIMLKAMSRQFPKDPRDRWTAVWLGLLNNAAYLGLGFIAFKTVTAGMVALVASLMPIVTVALAWPVLGERITWKKALGTALGFSGTFIILSGRLTGPIVIDDPFGLFLAAIGMVCLAIGTVLYKKRGAHADALGMNGVQAGTAAIALLPLALLMENPGDVVLDFNFAWTLAYAGIVMTVGAFWLWFLLIRAAGAGAASAFHFLSPGLALLFAWLLLGEPVSMRDILGLIPVAIGILLVNWPAKPAQTPVGA